MSNSPQFEGTRTRRVYSTAHGDLVFGGRCLVMGILNVTPDSFSDGGQHADVDTAIRRANEMVREGADVLDIGGESTRPGSLPVADAEQIDRVIPVIRGVRAAGVAVPISIDTQSADVAAAAIDAGADVVNDVSGARIVRSTGAAEPQGPSPYADNSAMFRLLSDRDVPYIIMHMPCEPATMQDAPEYEDVVKDVGAFFQQRAAALEAAGVKVQNRMIVDPGIGFGKTLEHNLALIRACASYSADWPVVLGTSRKRCIGEILAGVAGRDQPAPSGDRMMGTAATVAHAALSGVEMVRVHDVRSMRDVVEVCHRLRFRGP